MGYTEGNVGKQIVYCGGCGKSLLEQDFEKGKAHTVEFQPYCTTCKPLPKPISSSTAVKALKSSARLPSVPPTARIPKAPASAKRSPLVLLLAGAGALFLLIIVIALASGGRKSAPRTGGETVEVVPIVVTEKHAPPPPTPRPEPVRRPREEPPPPVVMKPPVPPPPPAPPPPTPEPEKPKVDPVLLKWRAALAYATDRDYAAAIEALKGSGAPTALADVEYVRKVALAVKDTHQVVSKWPKGQKVSLDHTAPSGQVERLEGLVERAGPFRVEVKRGEERVTVELGEIAARSLAEIYRARPGRRPEFDAPVAALLCLLEGDAEAAKADVASVPERFRDYAAGARAAPDPRDAGARQAFAEAGKAARVHATSLEALGRTRALLAETAPGGFVRRNRASIENLASELGREYFFAPSDLGLSGGFKSGRVPKAKVETCWISERDVDAASKETFVEISYGALADTEYRGWVYAGGCCLETLGFMVQAGEQAAAVPAKLPILNLKAKHAQHTGPKEPERWAWVPLPLPRSGPAGVKAVRLITTHKGFGVAYAIVTSQRAAPPRDAEVKDLELGRAGAPAFNPLSADDLVGYWKFDENSGGSVADASGRGHGGQFRGDAKWGAGKTGSGLALAANDGFVEVGDAPDLCPGAITLAAWVNLPSMPTQSGNIVSKGQNGGYRFRVSNNGEVEVFDRGTENGLRTVEKLPLGQWVHLAVTGDPSGLKIYVNGRLSGSNTIPYGAPKVSHSLKIGAEPDFKEYFGGSIDEVCLYKRALTPSEVQHLYRLGPK